MKPIYKITYRISGEPFIRTIYHDEDSLSYIVDSEDKVVISAELVGFGDINEKYIYDHYNGEPTIKTEFITITELIASKYGRCDESIIRIRPVEETED